MKTCFAFLAAASLVTGAAADLTIESYGRDGALTVAGTFTNGIVTVESTSTLNGSPIPWTPLRNVFSTGTTAHAQLPGSDLTGFYRILAVDLSGGRRGFTNLIASYSTLTTIAGSGGSTGAGVNKWQSAFEN